jgi:hypothetical protein
MKNVRTKVFGIISLCLGFGCLHAQHGTSPDGYSFLRSDSTITITGYAGAATNISIPSIIDGLPVVAIGKDAFYRSLVTQVKIPSTVVAIGQGNFFNCNFLKSVEVPRSVTSIGVYVFLACPNLEAIIIDPDNTHFRSHGATLLSKSGTHLIACANSYRGEYVIPEGVTTVAEHAFWAFNAPTIIIPGSVRAISLNPFIYSPKVNSIYFQGDAPLFAQDDPFGDSPNVRIFYPVGTSGWGNPKWRAPTSPYAFTQAPRITSALTNQAAVAGGEITFTVNAYGAPSPSYQWYRNGFPISGGTAPSITFRNLTKADAGAFSLQVSNSAGTVRTEAFSFEVYPACRLSNLSVRTSLQNNQTLFVGAVARGGEKPLLVRVAGPALSQFGLSGMDDPRVEIFATGVTPVVVNENWDSSLRSTFSSVGAFPYVVGSRDAALVYSLGGAFTVQAKGTGSGVVLFEAFDLAGGPLARLINLSARNYVGTGENMLIAGFAVSGTGSIRVLVRAVGPKLRSFGVSGVLDDPALRIIDSRGATVAANDNWDAAIAPLFSQVGAFQLDLGSRDSVILATLSANTTYTVQVSGVAETTGEALVEIYEVW